MRIAIYTRVSKNDESQDPQNQLQPLRDYAKALKGEVVEEYCDFASGSGVTDRVSFLKLLDDADKHLFDLVLIWALDRFSREGISNTLGYIERLNRNGIALRSLKESWLDTGDKSLGQLLISIFAWVAAQERRRLVERTHAGLQKARQNGKRLGRPQGAKDKGKRNRSGYWLRYANKKNGREHVLHNS